MYQPVIKLCFIVSFIVCNVFSHGAETLKVSHDTQIQLLEENSDPCISNPCRNEGTCTVHDADYKCDCKEPFTGKHCETHPCLSSPCMNEGACISVENTYGCVCNEPYYGRHCENDPCSSNPCQNEGVCSVAGIDFNCVCKPSYFGKQCEIELLTTVTENEITTTSHYDTDSTLNEANTTVDYTTGVTESECYCGDNSVSCHLNWGKKVCKCKNNFAPKNEICVATCNFSDRQCLNGGRCRGEGIGTSVAGYFCQCIGNYIGPLCKTDACETMRNKCSTKRAVCQLRSGIAVCECPEGMTRSEPDAFCEDICDYRTCVHGRCQVRGNNSYNCICDEGFYGLNCEKIIPREISYPAPWGLILLILSIAIVIFSIASIIAVRWVKKLRKQVEVSKGIRNA